MKVAGLCWISVLLAVSLSVGDCATMDPDYVTRIAKLIQDNYEYNEMQFSVAVNIPKDPKNTEELEKVILPVSFDKLKEDLDKGKVYRDTHVVVGVPLKQLTNNGKPYKIHAEIRVLDNLGDLANTREGKILFLYSWYSACDRCTQEKGLYSILEKIRGLKNRAWESYAFVFHTVYQYIKPDNNGKGGRVIPKDEIQKTLRNLRTVINDDNIFRCYNPKNEVFRCVKCFVDASKTANPVDKCVQNEE
ncbi:hypothetical protein KUCAC02_013152 [Chaenocephalus aceratus]|uniref:Uncharacterized protein n=1 Tax=Chaenocephalus aceratus TaxID=36190 RepID=A0ACB9XDZ5_CHAAC|nr:hypothetical protein KUCAC02_013152 [Chaenocephalus aceratus]